MRNALLIVPALVAAISTSPAFAAPQAWQVGGDSFHLTGLDLQTVAGRAEALAKVEAAAARLCRNAARLDRDACRAEVLTTATRGKGGEALRTAIVERTQQPMWSLARTK
jgi:UrcA family protein